MILTDDGWCSNPKPLKIIDLLRLAILRKTLKIEQVQGYPRLGFFTVDLGF